MSETKQQKAPAGARGPMGGAPMGGEKPKQFKKTFGKLVKYMRSSLPAIIVAMIFAVASVVLVINIPNITGDATDELYAGITKMELYDNINASLAPQGKSLADFKQDGITETLGDLVKLNPEFSAYIDNIPEGYRNAILAIRLDERPIMDIGLIVKTLSVALVLIIISAGLSYVQGYILSGVAQKVSYRFRRDIDLKFSKLPVSHYDKTSNGEILSYLTNDVDTISTTLNQSLSQIITSITMLVGVTIMMFKISWILALMALVIVPLSFVLIMIVVKFSQKHFKNQQKFLGSVNAHIEEVYSGHKEVTLYNREDESIDTFNKENIKLTKSARSAQFLSGLMMPIMNFVGNIGYVATCVVGGVLVINGVGGLTIGNIQAFIQYVRQFNQPISQMANIMNTLQSAVAAAERVFGFVEAEEEMETGDKVPALVQGNIDFANVRFGYNPQNIIINNFSSHVSAGNRVAIVGPTGAGKTTMVKLLMRYYDLNGGEILLDGVPITNYTREGLRSHFGMVLQETWLFNGSIMENIRYGRLDATDEQVIEAAKIACADHFIRTLPGGYKFEINEEAGNISQGQKQLLTIARAVLNDPKVLILDEATSSVDTRTEQLIQKAMDRLMRGRTSFIIAHRLSTIKDADKILVMKDGDIIEQGTHNQLMQDGGFYSGLYSAQFSTGAVE